MTAPAKERTDQHERGHGPGRRRERAVPSSATPWRSAGDPEPVVVAAPRTRLVDRRLWAIGILLPVGFAIVLEVVRWQLEQRGVWSPGVFEVWHVAGLAVVVVGIVVLRRLHVPAHRPAPTARCSARTATSPRPTPSRAPSRVRRPSRPSSTAPWRRCCAPRGPTRPASASSSRPACRTRDAQPRTLTLAGDRASTPAAPPSRCPWRTARRWSGGWRSGTRSTPTSPTRSAAPPCPASPPRSPAPSSWPARWATSSAARSRGTPSTTSSCGSRTRSRRTPVLDAVVRHAATLLRADAAVVTVSPETSRSIRFESGPRRRRRSRPDGATVVSFGLPTPAAAGDEGAPSSPSTSTTSRVGAHREPRRVRRGRPPR